MEPRYELVAVDALLPHEETDEERTEELAAEIEADGYLEEPIVVDGEHHVILDGHHRYGALRRLGCRRAPAYVVDYDDPSIRVTLWDGASVDAISKEQVIAYGTSKRRFPPKTTRHLFEGDLPRRKVPLSKLR